MEVGIKLMHQNTCYNLKLSKDTQMFSTHRKRCSTSSGIRELQNRARVRSSLTPLGLLLANKQKINLCKLHNHSEKAT